MSNELVTHGYVELAAAGAPAPMTAPYTEHVVNIESIVAHGEDQYGGSNRIEIEFRPGRSGFDAASILRSGCPTSRAREQRCEDQRS